jgi:hypothetical protein
MRPSGFESKDSTLHIFLQFHSSRRLCKALQEITQLTRPITHTAYYTLVTGGMPCEWYRPIHSNNFCTNGSDTQIDYKGASVLRNEIGLLD